MICRSRRSGNNWGTKRRVPRSDTPICRRRSLASMPPRSAARSPRHSAADPNGKPRRTVMFEYPPDFSAEVIDRIERVVSEAELAFLHADDDVPMATETPTDFREYPKLLFHRKTG